MKWKEHLRDLQRQDDWDAAFFRNKVWEAQQVVLETRWEETWHVKALETRKQEMKTLVELLETLEEGRVCEALLETWSNIEMIWEEGGETTLNHYGKVLSAKEQN